MPHRGRTTAILLATGAVAVLLLVVTSFWGDIVWCFQSDMERIQGKWKVVSFTKNGRTEEPTTAPGAIAALVFEGPILRIVRPDSLMRDGDIMSYHLDQNHQPGWIDVPHSDKGLVEGIYEYSGANLSICLKPKKFGQRPTAFESKPGSNYFLWVLQRE